MINFSKDNDQSPDSSGEYTGASLTKPDMPQDFTICAAYMVEAWNTPFSSADLFQLSDAESWPWAFVHIYAATTYTQISVYLGWVTVVTKSERLVFPLAWIHVCVSLDTVTGNIRVVFNGEVLEDKVYPEAMEEDEGRPKNLAMSLGNTSNGEFPGMISHVNMFSSPLSTARMVALTSAGGEECGAPGDYISWEEEDWRLTSQAKIEMMMVEALPCRRESDVTVYTANFQYHSAATNKGKQGGCMDHCQKLGQGWSPSVQTLEEWNWLRKEAHAVTEDISVMGTIWLAATDEEVEGEWRDAFPPHDQLNSSVAWPWADGIDKDNKLGDTYNCRKWYTPWGDYWVETECISYNTHCLKEGS